MELTKLLFNNLSLSKNSLKSSSNVSMKGDGKFENCLNNASSNKKTNNSSNTSNKKSVSSNKNSDKFVKNADSKQTNSLENQNSTDNQNYDSSKKTENSNASEISEADKKKAVISEKESELQQEIAQILGVQPDEVENVLEQLGISVFELGDTENLLDFLQEMFNVNSPSELLNVEGIKDIMLNVKQVTEEKISDFAELFQNFDFEELKQEVSVSQENNDFSLKDDSIYSQDENNLAAEEIVNHAVVKNEKSSPQVKNREDIANINAEDAQTENTVVKTVESAVMQNNNSFNQQGFQNNNAMNSEGNSSFNSNNGISAAAFDNIDKAFSQIVSKTQSMRNVNTADVVNQIIEKFRANIVKQDISQIKITLKPEYLGDVSLKIVSENGIVSAQFTAENQKVKEIIESNFNELKNMLDEQGVQVSALSVSIGSENSNENRSFDDFQKSKSSKRINNIIDASSEVEEDNISEYPNEEDVLQTNVNYIA